MHLFLKILGVAGIILGSVLGVLLLVILLVLFVPVFYRILGDNKDGQHHIFGKVTWLFPVLYGSGGYEDSQIYYHARVLGFYLMRYPDKTSNNSKKKRKAKPEKKTNQKKKTKQKPEAAVIRDSDFEKEWVKETAGSPDSNQQKKPELSEQKSKNTAEFSEKKPKKTKENSEEKKTDIWNTLRSALSFFQEEENKLAFRELKNTLIRLARVLRPKKIKGMVLFGTDDPALTAQIIGIIAMIYGMIGYGIEVHPDFNEKRLDYEFEIAGHISVFSLICPLISLWKSGQLKILKHNFENIMTEK